MGSISVVNVQSLPRSLKLDHTDPLTPKIPGFSEKTIEVFSNFSLEKETADLTVAHQKMQNNVSQLQQLEKQLQKAEKWENFDKVLSLFALVASIAFVTAAIVGCCETPGTPLFFFGVGAIPFSVTGPLAIGGTYGAFTGVSHCKKRLSNCKTDDIHNYQTTLLKYLVLHEDHLRQEIGDKIVELQGKLDGWLDNVKTAILTDYKEALQELDAHKAIYNNSDEDVSSERSVRLTSE